MKCPDRAAVDLMRCVLERLQVASRGNPVRLSCILARIAGATQAEIAEVYKIKRQAVTKHLHIAWTRCPELRPLLQYQRFSVARVDCLCPPLRPARRKRHGT